MRRNVRRARFALGPGRWLTRIVLRKRIARARRRGRTVVAGLTIGGLVVLVLAAERERARAGR